VRAAARLEDVAAECSRAFSDTFVMPPVLCGDREQRR
jgi:hypothetical protein